MADTFADGTRSIISVLRPKGDGWRELPVAPVFSFGYPCRRFWYEKRSLMVMSAVEVADDGDGIDRGPEYHLSMSKQLQSGPSRCDRNEARWILDQFGLEGAEEDNHVPHGFVRNFWRPVGNGLVGLECACKAEEPTIVEDKGDFVWRPAPNI